MSKILSVIVLFGLFVGCNTSTKQIDAPFIVIPDSYPEPIPPEPVVPKNNLVYINSDEEYEQHIKTEGVEYFFATWCGPCQQQGPVYEQLAKENPEVIFKKIDVDGCPKATRMKGVRSIPTIFVKTERFIGFQTKENLQKAVDKWLKN